MKRRVRGAGKKNFYSIIKSEGQGYLSLSLTVNVRQSESEGSKHFQSVFDRIKTLLSNAISNTSDSDIPPFVLY